MMMFVVLALLLTVEPEGLTISDGFRLTGWKDRGDGVWPADLPRLVDPQRFDFAFKLESPAMKLRSRPFDYSRAESSLNK